MKFEDRQDFIDQAAIAIMASMAPELDPEPDETIARQAAADVVYDFAEALWDERERRRREQKTRLAAAYPGLVGDPGNA